MAIVITLIGGVCGWIAFEMNDVVTKHKESEMQKQIDEAKAAALPKPFKVRLIAFLDLVDRRIVPALAGGQRVEFSAKLDPSHFTDLQKLAAEPGAGEYLVVHPASLMEATSVGVVTDVTFDISPKLVTP